MARRRTRRGRTAAALGLASLAAAWIWLAVASAGGGRILEDAPAEPPEPADAGAADAAPGPVCAPVDAGPSSGPMCSRPLATVAMVASAPSCFVDTLIKPGDTGVLTYPCGGGLATATFGRRRFLGSFDGSVFDLCAGSAFHWSDGCDWTTAQRLSGSLSSLRLAFTYAEGPAPRQSGCTWACGAKGEVEVR